MFKKILRAKTDGKKKCNVPALLPPQVESSQVDWLSIDAQSIRQRKIKWTELHKFKGVTSTDFQIMRGLDKQRGAQLAAHPAATTRAIHNILTNVTKPQLQQYLLLLIDDIIEEQRELVALLHAHAHGCVWQLFGRLLASENVICAHLTARILAKLGTCSRQRMRALDLQRYMAFLLESCQRKQNRYLIADYCCLQRMLRYVEYRAEFVQQQGIAALLRQLPSAVNYAVISCLRVLTFHADMVALVAQMASIGTLCEILAESQQQKVQRVLLALFCNIAAQPPNEHAAIGYSSALLEHELCAHLSKLEALQVTDEDWCSDLAFLQSYLSTMKREMVSFKQFQHELHAGKLLWSPVHKSAEFWQENVARLNENGHELLLRLINMLEPSADAVTLAVASHDIGEYAKYMPGGAKTIQRFNGRKRLFSLFEHPDDDVKFQALLTMQRVLLCDETPLSF